jgi:hypothetical protein
VVTSTDPEWSRCAYVNGVPHAAQNVRRTGSDELNSDRRPRSHSKLATGKVTHATTGAAATRRQLRQWHTMLFVGAPVIR